MLTLISQTD